MGVPSRDICTVYRTLSSTHGLSATAKIPVGVGGVSELKNPLRCVLRSSFKRE
jgi:hypothetical protein